MLLNTTFAGQALLVSAAFAPQSQIGPLRVHLATNTVPYSRSANQGQFNEATFNGYTSWLTTNPATLSYGADGTPQMDLQQAVFISGEGVIQFDQLDVNVVATVFNSGSFQVYGAPFGTFGKGGPLLISAGGPALEVATELAKNLNGTTTFNSVFSTLQNGTRLTFRHNTPGPTDESFSVQVYGVLGGVNTTEVSELVTPGQAPAIPNQTIASVYVTDPFNRTLFGWATLPEPIGVFTPAQLVLADVSFAWGC
jgi:hypothetical protein